MSTGDMDTPYGTLPFIRLFRDEFGVHYLEVFFDNGKTCGTPAVGLNEEGADGLDDFIQGGITGNRQHDIFKERKYFDRQGVSYKRSLVWNIHEGVQVKYGRYNEARLWNLM